MKSPIFILCFICCALLVRAQAYEERDIKSFGATGNGITNDHAAFQKAADYFNKRGGNGKLIISEGTYVVGKQTYTKGKNGAPCYWGEDLLSLANVHDVTIEGKHGVKIVYDKGLRFGAFDPATGEPYEHGNNYFVKYTYAAIIGYCIKIDKCNNVTVANLELDGNSGSLILGGVYGDVGRQLPHCGVFIGNSKGIVIDGLNVHHFGLDGITVGNKVSSTKDNILLQNSSFEYNSRQGLSWIGGNELKVKRCKFNHTGRGAFSSSPNAGVDIEAEWGPNRNASFEDCEFINNRGCAMVADSGDSGYCSFLNCTFWGTTTWSIWVTKPGFTFTGCNIYGSTVHGYNSPNDKDATKYIDCHFEDKEYNGLPPYGTFLVVTNGSRRVNYLNCTFVSHTKKLIWAELIANTPQEKYQFNNCTFTVYNTNLPASDWIAVLRGMRYKNCKFEFSKESRQLGYWLNTCCNGGGNIDGGGNKTSTL
ncbi:right-handed parallel beta-helix repeat-containing protein [Flavisolibacter tropicus]|uniref:Right handed beta helix domain-containing protein n=1 Tax=Flavisolibacter tropicus TaxID=1492898 RepID=A0A172U0J1_9BACT|nr:right-handed parallel beta-helix repeat-containing protein [Flavisolibacter tropicus]ANE52698.1 hypothetical protein SY85_21690 [Flavisolibacter tropicus]